MKGERRLASWTRPSKNTSAPLIAAGEPDAVVRCADLVRQGGLVVFPTDTVYGIGADAFNPAAIRRLFQAKQRPRSKGIPILLADWNDLARATRRLPAMAQTLIAHFWPGPLTLIVPCHPQLPNILTPDDTIAVRMPDSHLARALIRAVGGLMAVSSANLSGHPAATDGRQALAELGEWVTAVLDAGPTAKTSASTVVDCTGAALRILREGPITASDLHLEVQRTL